MDEPEIQYAKDFIEEIQGYLQGEDADPHVLYQWSGSVLQNLDRLDKKIKRRML